MSRLTFINHASYLVESDRSVLVVDPWVEGNAFDNGWGLLDQSITNKMLIEYLAGFKKSIYIWLSHEHSDHFSVPFLKMLKENSLKVNFIFQKTLDGRVAQFLRKLGYNVTESNDNLEVIDPELSIAIFPYVGGDSYSLTMLNDFSILNINDCVVDDEKGAERVLKNYRKFTKNVDLLLTQFGYANWIGNPDERQLRKVSAKEKLDRISLQVRKFEPQATIPFASFVYFNDPDNFHTNDAQNTPKDVSDYFDKYNIPTNLIILKPWDTLDLVSPIRQESSKKNSNILHWVKLHHEIKPNSMIHKKISIDEIRKSYNEFRSAIFKSFLIAPRLLESLKFIVPIKFYLNDLGVNVVLSYRDNLTVEEGCKENCDISLTAATLNFILSNEYGANTTRVNGKFERISDEGIAIFSRHFSPQEYMKMGYGLTNPGITLKIVFGKLLHKLQKRAWDINPTAD